MELNMKTHDVQSVSIRVKLDAAFAYISDPVNLPLWTGAFAQADSQSARLRSPGGEVEIKLETFAQKSTGTIDWAMRFPDGAASWAYSRLTPEEGGVVYSFVLMAPPVALEAVEGALEAQKKQLAQELTRLKRILEAHDQA
jgi:hypothetical protein